MSNTYTYPKKEDLEIIVGDEKQQDFKPRLKIKRWGNEVNFSVGVISAHAGTDSKPADKVEWDDGHGTKAQFYEKEGDEFEFEIELASKPSSNILHLSIETKGLDFFYQPPLTEEELNDTIIIDDKEVCRYNRPENIVGSYSVYHSTATGNHIGRNNYRAGKFAHIYRPYATDSKGWRVWCDLHIEDDMQITISQDFLDKAVYPVIVDPTFGCAPDDPGSSSDWGAGVDCAIGSKFASPSNISTAQSFTVYINSGGVDKASIKGMFVLHSNLNIISNGIGNAIQRTEWGADWVTSVFSTNPAPTTSTDHILMAISADNAIYHYDAGSTDQGHLDDSNSFTSPQNLGSVSHSNRKYSIYCTYTAAAAGVAPTSIFYGPFVGPFGGPL